MNIKLVNKLIVDHLRFYGYHLEARILEREFNIKKPELQPHSSKLMDIISKAMDKHDGSALANDNDEEDSLSSYNRNERGYKRNPNKRNLSERSPSNLRDRDQFNKRKQFTEEGSQENISSSADSPRQKYAPNSSSNITNIAKVLRDRKNQGNSNSYASNEKTSNSFSHPNHPSQKPYSTSQSNSNQAIRYNQQNSIKGGARPSSLTPSKKESYLQLAPNGYQDLSITEEHNFIDTEEQSEHRENNSQQKTYLNNLHQQNSQHSYQKPYNVGLYGNKQPLPYMSINKQEKHPKIEMPPLQKISVSNQKAGYQIEAENRIPKKSPYISNTSFDNVSLHREVNDQSFYSSPPDSKDGKPDLYLKPSSQILNPKGSNPGAISWNVAKHPSIKYNNQNTHSNEKGSLTKHYQAFLSNSQRKVETFPTSTLDHVSHESLVNSFIINEKKDVNYQKPNQDFPSKNTKQLVQAMENNQVIFRKPEESEVNLRPKEPNEGKKVYQSISYQPKKLSNNSEALRNYNDRLISQPADKPFYSPSPMRLGFTKEPSPFGRVGVSPTKKDESMSSAKPTDSYIGNQSSATIAEDNIDPKLMEYLRIHTSFKESEIRALFCVYGIIVNNRKNPTLPMDKKNFKEFMAQTRNTNCSHFAECLFQYGVQMSLMNNTSMIDFREAVVILDKINQDNPFGIMYFIFKVCTGEQHPEASLSLVETLLKELKPANLKGRISVLLDSLDYVYTREGISRAGFIAFEKYMEIAQRYEPMRKYC